MKKVAIVSPVHIQPSSQWIQALVAIQKGNEADIILVDDSDGELDLPFIFDVYGYERQKAELGEELYGLFTQFHKSSACKQFGLWLAYKKGYEYVIVIDSDCIVPPDFVRQHLTALKGMGNGWDNPLQGTEWFSRGFPYSKRNLPIAAHMGLWDSEWDLYGTDRLVQPFERLPMPKIETQFPAGYFPLSGMNVSFRREAIPYMLFLPNFTNDKQEKFTRHDDIWGGYIFQKLMKAKGYALSYGQPYVFHDTIVVAEEDALAEEAMIKHEDDFYYFIDSMLDLRPHIGDATVSEIFSHLGHAHAPGVFENLLDAFIFQSKAYANI